MQFGSVIVDWAIKVTIIVSDEQEKVIYYCMRELINMFLFFAYSDFNSSRHVDLEIIQVLLKLEKNDVQQWQIIITDMFSKHRLKVCKSFSQDTN